MEKKNILIGRSVNEYVNHITSLLNDEKKRIKIGESGRKYVIENFNWKTANDKLLRLLKPKKMVSILHSMYKKKIFSKKGGKIQKNVIVGSTSTDFLN